MKRVLLLSLALLLTLTLLPTVSMAAPGKNKKEPDYRTVTFAGDITGTGELQVLEWGKNFRLYTPTRENTPLEFVDRNDLWVNKTGDYFGGVHKKGKLGITITKSTGEASIIYNFDEYESGEIDERYVGWPKYQLEGYGQWEGKSMPYGSVSASGDFKISQMFYTSMSKGKAKSATGVTFEEVWTGLLSFTITIDKD